MRSGHPPQPGKRQIRRVLATVRVHLQFPPEASHLRSSISHRTTGLKEKNLTLFNPMSNPSQPSALVCNETKNDWKRKKSFRRATIGVELFWWKRFWLTASITEELPSIGGITFVYSLYT